MRTAFTVVLAAAFAVSAASADIGGSGSPTQQSGILMPQGAGGTPWLLGSLSEKLQVSHSVAFGYSSGGGLSGPSGGYTTSLAYPFSNNLRISASLGLDWNPAFADVTGDSPTSFGLREVRLDWKPSKSTHVSFGYTAYPNPWLLRHSPYGTRWGGGMATWGPDAP